jgi:hypothetical protein
MKGLRNHWKLLALGIALIGMAHTARGQGLGPGWSSQPGDRYEIMRPEPGERIRPRPAPSSGLHAAPEQTTLQARSKRRIGSSSPSPLPPPGSIVTPLGTVTPLPEAPRMTGENPYPVPVPGFPAVPPQPAPPGSPSFGDKALGCVHYGMSQGVGPGQIGAYTGACVNTR